MIFKLTNAFFARLRHARLLILVTTLFSFSGNAQTTLVAGDLAFIGYYRASSTNAGFTYIMLRPVVQNTVIYFTDRGIDENNWIANTEGYTKWTVPINIDAGTIVHVITQSG